MPTGRSFRIKGQTKCAVQHGVPADRFAREILAFLEVGGGALAAAERQTVGRV